MQADGSGATNLTNNPGLDSLVPGWSPDGTQILYTAAGHAVPVLRLLARRWASPPS